MRVFKSLDELAGCAGSEIGVSDWIDVDQKRIDAFADATGDHQWIHVDPKRCEKELGTGTIAHGYLTLSLLAGLSQATYRVEALTRAINYGSDKVRFLAPVPAGSRLRARFHLLEADRQDNRLKTRTQATMEIEGSDKPALIAEVLTLFYE